VLHRTGNLDHQEIGRSKARVQKSRFPQNDVQPTGRRSGLARVVVLVYVRDGGDILVVGSNFGKNVPPSWLLNLERDPAATVNLGRKRFSTKARIVMPGDAHYEDLIAKANAGNRQTYVRYRALTARPIPFVVLGDLTPL
jgi:deazaflavin-dependent oxidoreductase (nitroreductase family)